MRSIIVGMIAALLVAGCFQPPIRVIDGDTVQVGDVVYRLMGYDTPELRGACEAEKEMAVRAKEMVERMLERAGTWRIVKAGKKDRYGRELGWLHVNGKSVGAKLIEVGLAREYHGGKREGWC